MTTAASPSALALDVYGLRASIGGDWQEVIEALRLDFAWFAGAPGATPEVPDRAAPAGTSGISIAVHRREPGFDRHGDLPAAFVTPRNTVYQAGGTTLIDYFGRALAVYDRESGHLTVEGMDKHLVHEAAYLYLLSRVGEWLDRAGLPRMHALGLTGASGGAVAVMLPSGGGKSTMAVRALRATGISLLSEDSPLMDRRGRLHPFPLRIGVNATDAASLPSDHVRRIERMEFHPKLLLDIEAFADRIATEPSPLRHIVIGRRRLGREARLERLPRRAAAGTLLREVVIGVGLYQGMEFVLQRGLRDVARSARPALVRATACAAALSRARVWSLELGRDHDRNWEAIEPLLR